MAKDSIVDDDIISISVEKIFIRLHYLLVALTAKKGCLYLYPVFTG
jgi:hypothetical protein